MAGDESTSVRPSGVRLVLALLAAGIAWIALGALLGRLVWMFWGFGLFFYLLAALIVGGIAFIVLRPLRPLSAGRVLIMSIILTVMGSCASTYWEYRFIAGRAGEPPRFARARNALMSAGRDHHGVPRQAADLFRQRLRSSHWPGGPLGYVRWAVAGGRMMIELGDLGLGGEAYAEELKIAHRGFGWILRSAVCIGLMFVGVRWQLASLTSREPVNNLIDPEEAEFCEQEDRRQAGEPYYELFEHTADIGFEVHARRWPELLEQSARGLMACIGYVVPRGGTRPVRERIELSASSRENLLRDWLAELLYRFETRGVMPQRIKFREADDRRMVAVVEFRPVDMDKSRLHREVKAVTYHGLAISEEKKKMSARVLVDI